MQEEEQKQKPKTKKELEMEQASKQAREELQGIKAGIKKSLKNGSKNDLIRLIQSLIIELADYKNALKQVYDENQNLKKDQSNATITE